MKKDYMVTGKTDTEETVRKLSEWLPAELFKHSRRTACLAERLADRWASGLALFAIRARLAGWLHDCGKPVPRQDLLAFCETRNLPVDSWMRRMPGLLHGPAGTAIAREMFGCRDREIRRAIAAHTLGRPGMGLMEKIVFVADYAEEGRDHVSAAEVREKAFLDLDTAVVDAIDGKLIYLIKKRAPVHPRMLKTRNFLLLRGKGNRGEVERST